MWHWNRSNPHDYSSHGTRLGPGLSAAHLGLIQSAAGFFRTTVAEVSASQLLSPIPFYHAAELDLEYSHTYSLWYGDMAYIDSMDMDAVRELARALGISIGHWRSSGGADSARPIKLSAQATPWLASAAISGS